MTAQLPELFRIAGTARPETQKGQRMSFHGATSETSLTIPRGLTSDLISTLCLLEDAPPGVAESTIALLPYGSRSNLAAHGIIGELPLDKGAAVDVEITTYGWHVISACARLAAGGDTDEHLLPRDAGRADRLTARWREKAESVDRELTRMKARTRERVTHKHVTSS